ncbi:hypothetical protein Pelo_7064 [Pelomyxa schiedti]|nr:hypothetical protein Pelo_7064 [Pelomyxa schiedti]
MGGSFSLPGLSSLSFSALADEGISSKAISSRADFIIEAYLAGNLPSISFRKCCTVPLVADLLTIYHQGQWMPLTNGVQCQALPAIHPLYLGTDTPRSCIPTLPLPGLLHSTLPRSQLTLTPPSLLADWEVGQT